MAGDVIGHWLAKRAWLTPERTAIEQPGVETINFRDLDNRSRVCAYRLHSIGVTNGTHVGVLSGNHIDMAVMIHALSYLGAVAVLLNTRLANAELAYQIEDADVTNLFVSDDMYDYARQIQTDAPIRTFSNVAQLEAKDVPLNETINLDDPFTIIYTSGTTGFAKGVVHTYGNHWWSAIGSVLNLGLQDDDKWLCVLPLFHVSGLSILFRSVIYGISVHLLSVFDAQQINNAIRFEGVTIASVVTVMLQRLVADLDGDFYPETFRCMLIGGGPVPEPLLKTSHNLSIPVFQTYGMTETASQIATLSAQDALGKLGSAGKALMPAQLHVNAKQGEVGEIFVRGPMVTNGYYRRPEATDKAIENGWLSTGDLGRLDDDGFLFVVERHHDLIISGGENVYPTEIENILYKTDWVKEAAVVGKTDDQWGQVPVAFVVVKEGKENETSAEHLVHLTKQHLASYKCPKHIYFVDSLPRNATNKIMRHKLLETLQTKSDS